MKSVIKVLVVMIVMIGGGSSVTLLFPTHNINPVDSCVLVYNEGGHGSGVIIGSNVVLTAKHVAVHEDLIIRTNSGTEHNVIDVVMDPNSDAALLYIEDQFTEPSLSISLRELRVGDSVIIVGTPNEQVNFNCVLPGTIVKINMEVDYGVGLTTNLDIDDAHGGPGCSGGPVIYNGKVVGIVVMGGGNLMGTLPTENFVGGLGL